MKILLMTPIHRENETSNSKKIKGIPYNQGQAAWIKALEKLGHEVKVYRYTETILIPNRLRIKLILYAEKYMPSFLGKLRRKFEKYYKLNPENFVKTLVFKKLTYSFNPELIIISGGLTSIFPEAFQEIKKKIKVKIILFSGINPLNASTSLERQLIRKQIIDLVIENDKGYAKSWMKLGAQSLVLPISSVDPTVYKKLRLSEVEEKKYNCDVCFVGTLSKSRQKILGKLLDFNIKIWGDILPGEELEKKLNSVYKGTAHGLKTVKIYNASKIVLNFQPEDMSTGGNMRTFEIPACGSFQLVDRYDSRWFVEGKEIVSFSDSTDLKRKIVYYLSHEKKRTSIADAGYKKAHTEHTYELHFKKLIANI